MACSSADRSVLEETVLRPRQAEVLAQGLALVLAAEDAAALQLGHHPVDEIIEPAGQIGEHDREAVGAAGLQPLLHFVGDGRGRADHGDSFIAAAPLSELSHLSLLDALPSAC